MSKEKILEYFEKESGDRLLDRVEYAERVIFPAMENYAKQFLNPIVAENIFELIGQGVYKINCGEMSIGGLADEVEEHINQEVEKRIAERMPSRDCENRELDRRKRSEEAMGYTFNEIKSFEKGIKFGMRFYKRLLTNSSQKTEGGGE